MICKSDMGRGTPLSKKGDALLKSWDSRGKLILHIRDLGDAWLVRARTERLKFEVGDDHHLWAWVLGFQQTLVSSKSSWKSVCPAKEVKIFTVHSSEILNRSFSISQKTLSGNRQHSCIPVHQEMRVFPVDSTNTWARRIDNWSVTRGVELFRYRQFRSGPWGLCVPSVEDCGSVLEGSDSRQFG